MHPIQLLAISCTLVLPLALFGASRWLRVGAFDAAARRVLAMVLLALEVGIVAMKFGEGTTHEALPMHLCDWTFVAVTCGLWFRSQTGFELAYFWALAGTIQALFTPAIDLALPWWRLSAFFFSHALIVAGVLHLLLVERMRPWPRSLWRLWLWSEGYLAAALLTNALTGSNYGFLAHPPEQATLLDRFPAHPVLYVGLLNLIALAFFAVLYLPWLIRDVTRQPGVAPTRRV